MTVTWQQSWRDIVLTDSVHFNSEGLGAAHVVDTIEPVVVFVVEDEPLIQQLVSLALEDAGFKVELASDGPAAIAALEDGASRFKAIVTDIRLGPGPDGWAVATKARHHSPDLPVVYMSGDSAHEWSAKGVPKSAMISKPFAPVQIVTAVAALLNEAPSPQAD